MTNKLEKISFKIKNLAKSEVEIEGEMLAEDFSTYENEVIEDIKKNYEAPGFRKGHVPEETIRKNVAEAVILEEMAQLAIKEIYIFILNKEKIDAIGYPKVDILKLARGNPLGFKITTTIMPKVELPDYKKIAEGKNKDKKEIEVGEEEIEKTILEIRKMRKKASDKAVVMEKNNEQMEHVHTDNCDHPNEEKVETEAKEEDLPEFNDDFVKALGKFENVADFRQKLKDNIKFEKEVRAREEKRMAIIEDILKETKAEIPQLLIDVELDKILGRIKYDIEMAGFKFEDYLTQIKKTEIEIRKEMEKDGEKQAKLQLVLNQISVNENIHPEEEEIQKEVAKVLAQYKEVDKDRARTYVESVLLNEKVFQFLEKDN